MLSYGKFLSIAHILCGKGNPSVKKKLHLYLRKKTIVNYNVCTYSKEKYQ